MLNSTGAIVGNSLVSLSSGMDRQDREDIFDCLFRAERIAGQVSREQNFAYWTYRYGKALEQRSCEKKSSIVHQPMVIRSADELESVSFGVIQAAGSALLARQARASLQALQIHRYATHFFERVDGDSVVASFQVIPCVTASAGKVLVLLCGIRMTGRVDTRDFDFWTDSRAELVLRITGGAYQFDRDDYDRHRDAVASELGAHGERAIHTFVI